jgi:hypothetical protein
MNCEQNDLARIVVIHPAIAHVADRIVKCVLLTTINGEPAWKLDRRISFTAKTHFTAMGASFGPGDGAWFDTLQDKYLRPIRGLPGSDEVLREAGHPLSQSHREKVNA